MIDPGRNWITLCTTRGFLVVWDIRFSLPVKTWRLPSRARIHRLAYYNVTPKVRIPPPPNLIFSGNLPQQGSWIFTASGTGGVDVYDLDTGQPKQLFRTTEETPMPTPLQPIASLDPVDYGVEVRLSLCLSIAFSTSVCWGVFQQHLGVVF